MTSSHEPLIHVDYHKTGTSWLQTHLFSRDDRGFHPLLAASDVRPSRAKQVPKTFGRRFLFDDDGRYLAPLAFDPEAVRVAASSSATLPGVPVISNERLSGYPHAGGFDSKELAERLHRVFPAARILIVIREQRSILLTAYYASLKTRTASLPAYLQAPYGGQPGFAFSFYEYDRLRE